MAVCQHALEPSLLGFQFFEPLGVWNTHAAEFVAPQMKTRFRESVSPTRFLNRQARISLPEKPNDLFFRIALLHVQSPSFVGIGH